MGKGDSVLLLLFDWSLLARVQPQGSDGDLHKRRVCLGWTHRMVISWRHLVSAVPWHELGPVRGYVFR